MTHHVHQPPAYPESPLLVGERGQVVVRTDEHSRREYVVRPAYHVDPQPGWDLSDLLRWLLPRRG